ncbi:V-type ATP synthase subunit A [Desulfatiferula olefinivorans]
MNGIITKVSGPLVLAANMSGARMYDGVRVGRLRLLGEIIELKGDVASIQVYEDTAGVGTGEPVVPAGRPLSAELGPGLIGAVFDGIQRPLDVMMKQSGDYIPRGIEVASLCRDTRWRFTPALSPGVRVGPGDIVGTVRETDLFDHRIMVPPGVSGLLTAIEDGMFTVTDTVGTVRHDDGHTTALTLMQVWPVRIPRPVTKKRPPKALLTTGQRVIDTLFPLAGGGTACIPGPFGSGKTVVQHQLAKWSDADIVVYIGCGERGNEMTDVLQEFPRLTDPRSGQSLMNRTILIANTSNMPVAAREASIYTGITLAEYFRDMGFSVALLADSTSRWAEAMREISGRLEEMPGDEGYPAYLGTKVAAFYERAGRVSCLGAPEREGALSVIGAVSPAGGDLSDPVVQATLRVVKVYWSLEDTLAFQRHFPAISWLRSYSLYEGPMNRLMADTVDPAFPQVRQTLLGILESEAELSEIVRLVGVDALSAADRLTMKTARMIREDFLHQNAFHPDDAYTPLEKQFLLADLIVRGHRLQSEALAKGLPFECLDSLKLDEAMDRARTAGASDRAAFSAIAGQIRQDIETLVEKDKGNTLP